MKGFMALLLLMIASGLVVWNFREFSPAGEWSIVIAMVIHLAALGSWAFAMNLHYQSLLRVHTARIAELEREIAVLEERLRALRLGETQDAYHRDVCAVAYGELDEEEFDRRWVGRVPPSPRPPRKDRKIELFKEIMTDPQYAAEDKIHEHADPAFRKGQYVRFRVGEFVRAPEQLWRVREAIPSHLPDGLWWRYHVENVDGDTINPLEKELTLAVPSAGEWWEYRTDCETHHHAWDDQRSRPFQITAVDAVIFTEEYVKCGCLVPVHFGRGL